MITGKDRDGDMLESWDLAALPSRQPYGKLFKAAKTSRRFCQCLLPASGEVGRGRVAVGQIAAERADIV
jgi:hypothetical protein